MTGRHHDLPATPEVMVLGHLDAATPAVPEVASGEDLDDAAEQAVREMLYHVRRRTNPSRDQASMPRSPIGDLRVTRAVDGNKGVHMPLAEAHL